MTRRHLCQPLLPRLTTIAIPLVLLVGLLAAPTAVGSAQTPRAHAASSYLTGIGDEQVEMFTNPLWQQLHTRIVRKIVPYDVAANIKTLSSCYHHAECQAAAHWIELALAAHQQILLSFYHSERTPTIMPSVTTYQRDVQAFVKLFPQIRQYQSWDEANRGNIYHVLASPSAVAAAKYYQALIRVCRGCTVIGLDVLDAENIGPTLTYISEFKREIGALRTIMPSIWGLHNYSDINRLESWRTRELVRALGGQVWLTETGGIVQFGGAFPNRRGSGLTRAAKVLKYMFALAGALPQIKRLYIYDWTGGNASTRFDAGLMNARDQPRPGYVVVCKQLRGARCNVKTVNN
jgi:hypothetical protein